MLAVEGLLQALSDAEETKNYNDCNDDYDFGKVLELYIEPDKPDCEVMCSDGQKRSLLFND